MSGQETAMRDSMPLPLLPCPSLTLAMERLAKQSRQETVHITSAMCERMQGVQDLSHSRNTTNVLL